MGAKVSGKVNLIISLGGKDLSHRSFKAIPLKAIHLKKW